MKAIFAGLVTFLVVGVIGVLLLRGRDIIPSNNPSPAPSGGTFQIAAPSPTPSYSPLPSASPAPTVKPTTKGGQVLGTARPAATTTTTNTTTTRTVTHTKLTLMDSDRCPTTTTTEVRDITGDLTIRYSLKDNYAANITAWKQNGEEVIKQTRVEDGGELTKVSGLTYLKVQIQSAHCIDNDEHWITVTAEN